MSLAEGVLLWVSTFAQVFLLGMQSRNVNGGRYIAAAMGSVLIGAAQLVVVRGAVANDPLCVLAITGTAGPMGVTSAMFLWARLFGRSEG